MGGLHVREFGVVLHDGRICLRYDVLPSHVWKVPHRWYLPGRRRMPASQWWRVDLGWLFMLDGE